MGIEFEAEQNVGKFRFNQSLSLVKTKVLIANEEARIEKGDRVPMVPRLTRRMGIEFEAEQNVGKFRFNQSLSLVKTKVLIANDEARIEKGDRVPMVPRLKATLGVKYNFTDRLSGYLNYVYLAKQESRELRENPDISKDDVIVKHTINGYGTLEAGLSYKPDNYSDIKIGAKNILSKKYNLRETSLEALPAPERNYYLQLNVRF